MTNSDFFGGVAGGNKRRRFKKIILWTLLAVQIFLIFCFWCMQTSYPQHNTINENYGPIIKKPIVGSFETLASPFSKATLVTKNRVNFVTRTKQNMHKNQAKDLKNKNLNTFENVSNFTKDFVETKINRLMNITGIEAEMINEYDMNALSSVWCFRQGTLNDKNGSQTFWNIDTQQAQCMCQQYWHGKDCSQNEVIYRAFMLPRNQFTLREPIKAQNAHLLVYMLEGYFCSLDFLELQIKPMTQVVDHFLIFWHGYQQDQQQQQQSTIVLKALKRKLDEMLEPARYTLYQCNKTLRCTQTDALLYFRTQMKLKFGKRLQPTDLLLHSNENVLLSKDALRFFKYYAPSAYLAPWRFRLKHNVFGFFWQHPDKTYLDGFLSSFSHLDEPERLTTILSNNRIADGLRIIGDLNHFGGWYCQYCAHPDEIIAALNQTPDNVILPTAFEDKKQDEDNIFRQLPKNSRNNLVIDSKYLEYLIAQGVHINGKTRLQKVRLNSDAYYAPAYAEKMKWKFGNLLTNLFEAIENDYVLDEAEGGFGF